MVNVIFEMEQTVNNLGRNIAIWVIIGASLIALFNIFQSNDQVSNNRKVAYSDFMAQVRMAI